MNEANQPADSVGNNKLFRRLKAFLQHAELRFRLDIIEGILGWHIENFMAVLLNIYRKKMVSSDYMEMCCEMSKRLVDIAATNLYYRVADLVPGAFVENFKQNLREFGHLKKRFANDVWGILSDVHCYISSC